MAQSVDDLKERNLIKVTEDIQELLESNICSRNNLMLLDDQELIEQAGKLKDLQETLITEKKQKSFWWAPVFLASKEIQRFHYLEQELETLRLRVIEIQKEREQNKEENLRKQERTEIEKKRNERYKILKVQHFRPRGFANKLRSNVINGYSIDFLWPGEVEILKRKKKALDDLFYAGIKEGDAGLLRSSLQKANSLASGALSTLKVFAEETSFGIGKTISLFFAWPYIAPVKAVNWLTKKLIEKPFWALGGFFETFRTEIPKFFKETFPYSADWKTKEFWQDPKNIAFSLIRGIGGLITIIPAILEGASKATATVANIIQHIIDTDKWFQESPVTSAFARGAIGTVILIAVVLAGIPTLGIVPAFWLGAIAVGAAFASVMSVITGYRAAKNKADELSTLTLSPEEELKLAKAELNSGIRLDQDNINYSDLNVVDQKNLNESNFNKTSSLQDKIYDEKFPEHPMPKRKKIDAKYSHEAQQKNNQFDFKLSQDTKPKYKKKLYLPSSLTLREQSQRPSLEQIKPPSSAKKTIKQLNRYDLYQAHKATPQKSMDHIRREKTNKTSSKGQSFLPSSNKTSPKRSSDHDTIPRPKRPRITDQE